MVAKTVDVEADVEVDGNVEVTIHTAVQEQEILEQDQVQGPDDQADVEQQQQDHDDQDLVKVQKVEEPEPEPEPVAVCQEPLFRERENGPCILLVDASASTRSKFSTETGELTIFNKFLEVVRSLGHEDHRVLSWNSEDSNAKYVKGAYVLPFVVKAQSLGSTWLILENSIVGQCLTCPHLGFNAIPKEWFNGYPTVYYITDGEIGWGGISDCELRDLKQKLGQSIREISKQHVRFCIITVESKMRDFNQVEANAAGNDVYKIIAEQQLTGLVDQFVSYTPKGRFVQINKNKPDLPGYIPYEDKSFSEFRTSEFMRFIRDELKAKPNEEDQVRIAMNLSSTLSYLTKDKPPNVMRDVIRSFSMLFTIDHSMIRFILNEAIEKERGGNAALYSSYRAQLKSLFQQADQELKKDVKNAINLEEYFVSYPIGGRILMGSSRLVDKTLTVRGTKYPMSGFMSVPVFPLDGTQTGLQEQCLRQWTRAVFAALYNTNVQSDEIIYLVMGVNLLVNLSPDIPQNVKDVYKKLSHVMLKKKRLNTVDVTELQHLEAGNLPIPNSGRINDFFNYMDCVSLKLNIIARPMKLWYEICRALGGKLFSAQEQHCLTHAEYSEDFKCGNCPLGFDEIPDEIAYDYKCIVTLDDLTTTGGYRILPHKNIGGYLCSPVYLLSNEGKEILTKSVNCMCPICYTPLRKQTGFARVGPKIAFDLPESYENRLFVNNDTTNNQKYQNPRRQDQGTQGQGTQGDQRPRTPGTLVVLRGTVGAGKSTYAHAAKQHVEAKGGKCVIASTDFHCKQGKPMGSAVSLVEQSLRDFLSDDHKEKIAVIDVCNERYTNGQSMFFNVDFSGWKQVIVFPNLQKDRGQFVNLDGYLAWSLRNVLQRKSPQPSDTHWLNPVDTSEQLCKDVHKKKSTGLFGGKAWKLSGATITNLGQQADAYAKTISPFHFDF